MRRRGENLGTKAASALLAACEAKGAFQDGKEVFAAVEEARRAAEGKVAASAAERAATAAALSSSSSSSSSSPSSPSSSRAAAGEGILFAGRKLVYSVPGLLQSLPPPLIGAARAAVEGGQAARRWVGENTQQDKDKERRNGGSGNGNGGGGAKGKSKRAKGKK